MEETLVFIDEGFLDKLTKLFGEGKRIKYDNFDKNSINCKEVKIKCLETYLTK